MSLVRRRKTAHAEERKEWEHGRAEGALTGIPHEYWLPESQACEAREANMGTDMPGAAGAHAQEPAGDVRVRGAHRGGDILVLRVYIDAVAAGLLGVYPQQAHPPWVQPRAR